jgi:hypothetical protein
VALQRPKEIQSTLVSWPKTTQYEKTSSGCLFTCLSDMNGMWVWSKITKKTETEKKKVLFVLLGLIDDQRYKSREQVV